MVAYTYYLSNPRVRREAEALAEREDKVDFICLRKEGEKPFERTNGVNLYRLPQVRYRGSGVFVYIMGYFLFFVCSFLRLNLLYFRQKYDLIHAHYGLTGVLARFQFRYPVIVSFCGSDVMDKLQGKISKFLTRFIDVSIVKSKSLKQKLENKRAWVIPSGVDIGLFKPIPMKEARGGGLDLTKIRNIYFSWGPKIGKKRE